MLLFQCKFVSIILLVKETSGLTQKSLNSNNLLQQRPQLPNNIASTSIEPPGSQTQQNILKQTKLMGSLAEIFTAEHFNRLKPENPNCQGAKLYTYEAFQQAASTSFPSFGTTGDLTARKHDVAGFVAHVMHETELCFVDEQNPTVQDPKQYCQASASYPCAPGANYHGRGPLQISWNYNYIDFRKTLTGNSAVDLYQHPEQLTSSGMLLFQSALFAYMRPNTPDSMHNLMLRNPPAFGLSTKVINGALECGGGNSAQVNSRSKYFIQICGIFGVDPGNQLTC